MECKGALKIRWTTVEVAMLTEEWANVCASPGYKVLKGDDLNQAIFNRYNARCARTRQLRRSPHAVATQRDRMVRFARFVADFDRAELAKGRRVWLDLSNEEQLQFNIPNKWRRQVATFTLDILNTFKRSILPAENAHNIAKHKKAKKLAVEHKRVISKCSAKHKKVSSQSIAKHKKVTTSVEPQPCWTTEEKVHVVKRCAKFMKHKGFTLEDVEKMTFDKSYKCLASSKRSSFSTWRKLRTLLSSWRFIHSFNVKHQPGWFELSETERDLLIAWGDLPDNFEDIEVAVFAAMEGLAPKDIQDVKDERDPPVQSPRPPSPMAISLLQPAPLGPIPLLTELCPKDVNSESTETDETIERLLLEDEGVDTLGTNDELREPEACVIEPLGGKVFVPDDCIFVAERTHGMPEAPVVKHEVVRDQPLEPAPINSSEGRAKPLQLMLQTRKGKILADLRQLQATLEQENKCILESIPAEQFTDTNAFGLLKYVNLVLEQQNNRVLSVLRLAEETCSQNDAELESLVQNWLGSGLNPSCNGTIRLGVEVHGTAPNGFTL
ncbi:hypothetical protein JG687_00004137 [Phytophthora cactorum]|uniref:Uncharacterized protein n=1 Tax=Phytophthora cactorum TaxID=29920 RepID=A0A329ST36_9STRA|nr:hypothetical protein Pcac1_g22401 [Phytophthora cactorum]KAG2826762.1 hypothetical protein PC111_g8848 [Phytophthora cactorum]KAG2827687.1 hypothetical protein PC112_g8746 [Phytophthora cactorum]KAG2857894.1 hypothetical protein PC113_g10297 [Phytophthora cactorum]KAG2907226.1 hypothetical protein PC114_g10893 [Phytophthora cactorum]